MSAPNTKQMKLDGSSKIVSFFRIEKFSFSSRSRNAKSVRADWRRSKRNRPSQRTGQRGNSSSRTKIQQTSTTALQKTFVETEEKIHRAKSKFDFLRSGSDLISKIPSFWISVFLNHPQLSSHLDQNDENILQYLKRVDVEEVRTFHDDKLRSSMRLFLSARRY